VSRGERLGGAVAEDQAKSVVSAAHRTNYKSNMKGPKRPQALGEGERSSRLMERDPLKGQQQKAEGRATSDNYAHQK